VNSGFLDKLTEFLNYFEPKIKEYNDLLTYNHIFVKRTANVGVISASGQLNMPKAKKNLANCTCDVTHL
jgi:NADH:ubiquinone oxidoreductase subunit D